ncbi:MAG: outer membrane protein assembly factor BamA [Candidatus Omnitrophica bacterium]|nr:outer membrane protein assembly factor BamA [Candidatus Omnitrophota bacterium]MDD5592956.1 outer membrane protein assembly factor BamA [Candidatus Omnitrophota bacterium]
MRKRVIILLGVIFILSGSIFSFAQDETSSGQETAVSSQGTPVKLVTAIEIKGNQNISTNTIVSKMKTRVGSSYQENIVSDDLKRLYLLGFFSDINIDTQPYKDGVKVVITVKERPIIEKITFSGILRLTMKEDKIKESLKSKEGQYLDYPNLSEDIKAIKKLYEKIGYSQAGVNYKVDMIKETGRVRIEFSVDEGKRTRVKKIFVEGNKNFSDKRIIKLMKTKQAWFFNAGVLKDEVLQEDIERIKSFYHREGYTDVAVDYKVEPEAKKKYFLDITINVQEGKKYLVGNVTIEGNNKLSRDKILLRLKECVPGKVFSTEALRQDIMNIQALYFDQGYIFAQVQEATSLNSYTGRIDITYNITENEAAYVDKIKIRGNVKTKDIVIRRELRIKPGDKFDGEKLKRSKERLQNLGFFEDVNYDTEDTNTPDKKDLVVEVKETKTGAFSFGGGYSSVDKLVGFIEVEQKNFDWKNFPYFTGAGQDLKLRASLGTVTEEFDLSFTEPWLFDYPVSFGFDGYKRVHKRESDIGYGYDENIVGGDMRLGKEITEYIRGNFMYRYDIIKITNITDNASNDLRQEYGENHVSSASLGLTYDSTDNMFDPTKGDVLTLSGEWAGGPFAGDKDFLKFFSRASHYVPLIRGSVLEFRGRLGMAKSYGDSTSVPIYERFFAGGAYTIRGYDERRVGPLDSVSKDPLGGESMLVGNIEYTFPVASFIKLAAFYDVGNVWSQMSRIADGGFKSGFGLGVRIKTPIGPVMVDYGIPLNKEPGEDKKKNGQFHFNMSQGF